MAFGEDLDDGKDDNNDEPVVTPDMLKFMQELRKVDGQFQTGVLEIFAIGDVAAFSLKAVDFITVHGPNCLVLSEKVRREFLSAIQEAANMGLPYPAERRSVAQLATKLHQICAGLCRGTAGPTGDAAAIGRLIGPDSPRAFEAKSGEAICLIFF
ncbi:hypothetical protein RHMOL_Rhmol13G0173100 [Rhododendron molle]|uniref:Uncharacterized protein n=1 Tax=Rhododendron molle TaxID=49168 RepID=A0ACC0L8A8_RHOML|nr:hypothetical protein RHMOL_Rhmol13G0173100 [Rhododendron molle]